MPKTTTTVGVVFEDGYDKEYAFTRDRNTTEDELVTFVESLVDKRETDYTSDDVDEIIFR